MHLDRWEFAKVKGPNMDTKTVRLLKSGHPPKQFKTARWPLPEYGAPVWLDLRTRRAAGPLDCELCHGLLL